MKPIPYVDIEGMSPAESGEYRGTKRWHGRKDQSHLTGRRIWQSVGSTKRTHDPEALIGLEKDMENILRYDGLNPTQSTFEAVTATCLLYAPQYDEKDIRIEEYGPDFHSKANTQFRDPNYGRPIFEVRKKAYHGWACECYSCVPSNDPYSRDFGKEEE